MLQYFFLSMFCSIFCIEHGCLKSTCQIWPFISKKMLNMYLFHANVCSFYKRNMCCECQYIFYGHWPCCIQMDSIDSFKFLCESFWLLIWDCALTDLCFPHSGQVTVTFWPRFHRTVTGAILNVGTWNRNCDCNCYCTEIST